MATFVSQRLVFIIHALTDEKLKRNFIEIAPTIFAEELLYLFGLKISILFFSSLKLLCPCFLVDGTRVNHQGQPHA